MVRIPAVEERLVPIGWSHQDLWRGRDGEYLEVTEVLAELAGGHYSNRRSVLAAFARFPPDDDLLAVVADEADAADVLVLLVTVDNVLQEDRVDLGHVLDVGPGRLEKQRTTCCCGVEKSIHLVHTPTHYIL